MWYLSLFANSFEMLKGNGYWEIYNVKREKFILMVKVWWFKMKRYEENFRWQSWLNSVWSAPVLLCFQISQSCLFGNHIFHNCSCQPLSLLKLIKCIKKNAPAKIQTYICFHEAYTILCRQQHNWNHTYSKQRIVPHCIIAAVHCAPAQPLIYYMCIYCGYFNCSFPF